MGKKLSFIKGYVLYISPASIPATRDPAIIVTNIIKKMIKFKSNLILDFLFFKSRISQNNRNKISKLFPK